MHQRSARQGDRRIEMGDVLVGPQQRPLLDEAEPMFEVEQAQIGMTGRMIGACRLGELADVLAAQRGQSVPRPPDAVPCRDPLGLLRRGDRAEQPTVSEIGQSQQAIRGLPAFDRRIHCSPLQAVAPCTADAAREVGCHIRREKQHVACQDCGLGLATASECRARSAILECRRPGENPVVPFRMARAHLGVVPRPPDEMRDARRALSTLGHLHHETPAQPRNPFRHFVSRSGRCGPRDEFGHITGYEIIDWGEPFGGVRAEQIPKALLHDPVEPAQMLDHTLAQFGGLLMAGIL